MSLSRQLMNAGSTAFSMTTSMLWNVLTPAPAEPEATVEVAQNKLSAQDRFEKLALSLGIDKIPAALCDSFSGNKIYNEPVVLDNNPKHIIDRAALAKFSDKVTHETFNPYTKQLVESYKADTSTEFDVEQFLNALEKVAAAQEKYNEWFDEPYQSLIPDEDEEISKQSYRDGSKNEVRNLRNALLDASILIERITDAYEKLHGKEDVPGKELTKQINEQYKSLLKDLLTCFSDTKNLNFWHEKLNRARLSKSGVLASHPKSLTTSCRF